MFAGFSRQKIRFGKIIRCFCEGDRGESIPLPATENRLRSLAAGWKGFGIVSAPQEMIDLLG